MQPEQQEQMQAHITEIAKILYTDSEAKGMAMGTLADIEQTVRAQMLEHVSPQLGIFLSRQKQDQIVATTDS